jgi:hypothetical protein
MAPDLDALLIGYKHIRLKTGNSVPHALSAQDKKSKLYKGSGFEGAEGQ